MLIKVTVLSWYRCCLLSQQRTAQLAVLSIWPRYEKVLEEIRHVRGKFCLYLDSVC